MIYRLTVDNITQALLNEVRSPVCPSSSIIEPNEYLNRKWPEFWLTHANLDKLWAAGVPIKKRLHDGLTHMKTIVTSNYATNASSNFAAAWQRDHNYFIPASSKPAHLPGDQGPRDRDVERYGRLRGRSSRSRRMRRPCRARYRARRMSPSNTSLVWNFGAVRRQLRRLSRHLAVEHRRSSAMCRRNS